VLVTEENNAFTMKWPTLMAKNKNNPFYEGSELCVPLHQKAYLQFCTFICLTVRGPHLEEN
jgi:hypothetical protein